MSGTSSSITRSPSTRPTLPSSNVTSFMAASPGCFPRRPVCPARQLAYTLADCVECCKMLVANLNDRLTLVRGDRALDVERASDGRFAGDPQAVYDDWDAFADWARNGAPAPDEPLDARRLGPPVPRPRQVFALGLNYAMHAREAGLELPPMPLTFTKFPSCIVGPGATVGVATDRVDWEVELVAVIGRRAHRVDAADAWDHVAGLTVGQDLSARDVQMTGSPPQFSLGKSFPGFGPTGPWLVTPDELENPDDLALGCAVNGEQM